MPSVTRRQVLFGGVAASVGGFVLWGRYAVGDTFEQHVADQLGLPVAVTNDLLGTLNGELGGVEYEARASAFLLATSSPSRLAMPGEARRQAIEAFVGPLLKMEQNFVTPYVIAGVQQVGHFRPCGVLRRDAAARS